MQVHSIPDSGSFGAFSMFAHTGAAHRADDRRSEGSVEQPTSSKKRRFAATRAEIPPSHLPPKKRFTWNSEDTRPLHLSLSLSDESQGDVQPHRAATREEGRALAEYVFKPDNLETVPLATRFLAQAKMNTPEADIVTPTLLTRAQGLSDQNALLFALAELRKGKRFFTSAANTPRSAHQESRPPTEATDTNISEATRVRVPERASGQIAAIADSMRAVENSVPDGPLKDQLNKIRTHMEDDFRKQKRSAVAILLDAQFEYEMIKASILDNSLYEKVRSAMQAATSNA